MSDQKYDAQKYGKQAASAYASASNNEEPEVAGHSSAYKFGSATPDMKNAVEDSASEPVSDVEGHGVRMAKEDEGDATESSTEVEGHGRRAAKEDEDNAGTEAEVEGHIHPVQWADYTQTRANDINAEILHNRQVHEARSANHDGGLIDKILHRKQK